jgi:parvulin-like peptidyl-prolyl isomerase
LSVIFRRIGVALLSAVALTSCSIVPSATDAFSVDDSTWSRQKFNDFLSELIGAGQINALAGGADAQDARAVATILLRQEATNGFLAEQGQSINDQDRAALLQGISSSDPFYSYSQTLQDVLIQINASNSALARVAMPSQETLANLYNTMPIRAGVLCLSHIVVSTRNEALSVLQRLKSGDDFAAVAREVSLEPAATQTGGDLANQTDDNPCFTLNGLRQEGFDPLFVAGAMTARAGVPTGPVKSSFGYHIIMNKPWSEVSDAVTALVQESPGAVLNEAHLAFSNISVASSIGRWNSVSGQIE